ncbi:MAG: hypothetical protein LAN64_08760 [Acidobacteriia bacterium]|nr:hypothetical protein [Terriglobia bacterium]
MRKVCLVLLAIFATAWLAGCGFTPSGRLSSSSSTATSTITVSSAGSSARLGDAAVQFTATGGSGGYTWAVNGVAGGSATTGTIDSIGKYTPPAVGATALANPTTVTITASAGGVTSAGVSLSLLNPIATVTSVAVTGGGSLLVGVATGITVTGANFVSGAQVVFGSSSVAATVASPTSLTATVTVTSAGSVTFSVKNPDPGSATSTTTANLTAANPVVIAGTAAKGLLNGASVSIFAVSPSTGADVGAALGTGKTDANGVFSVSLSSLPTAGAPLRVEVSGGTYVDETNVTNPPIVNTITLATLLDDGSVSVSGLAITPITDMISSATQAALGGSASSIKTLAAGGTASSTHATMKTLISGHWGVKSDPEKTTPTSSIGAASTDGFKVGLLSGAMLECAHKALAAFPTVDPGNFVKALGADIADGVFDGFGLKGGAKAQVFIPGTGTPGIPLSQYAGDTDFLSCVQTYVTSPNTELTKENGVPAGSPPPPSMISTVSSVVSAISAAIASSPATPPSAGIGASSSGAIGQLSFSGHQYVFIAAHTSGVAVADVTDPTAPTAKSWKGLYTTAFKNQAVGGVIPVIGTAAHAQAVVFAYGSKHIAVVNAEMLATGTPPTDNSVPAGLIDYEADLPIAATFPVGFSGGSAFIAGGIPVAGAGVWLATADGYAFFDLRTSPPTLGTPVPVPTNLFLAENLGGDTTHNFLLCGNYQGIQFIDISSTTTPVSYVADFLSGLPTGFNSSWDLDIDGDSVDTGLQVGILTYEDTNTALFLNLGAGTKTAGAAGAPNTLALPATAGKLVSFGTSPFPVFSGSAVDSSSHLALFMAGFSTSWGVGKLDDPAHPADATAGWQGLSDWIYGDVSTAFTGYFYATDPHAVGIVHNNSDGRTYGYLLAGSFKSVVQINMTDIVDKTKMSRTGTTGDAAHTPASNPATAGFMKQITWP